MNRDLVDRLPLIAPFLQFDKDPYVVVTDQGHLAYVQDAYTTSSYFPNAQAVDPSTLPAGSGLGGSSFDYVRNSVKIVMDAYDGTTTMYVSDPSDPIIRAWEGVFPGMFKPQSAMPAWLKAHLRYPEDYFDVQSRMYATYHVTDPATFYYQNDLWTVPQQPTSSQQLPLEAYYVEMRMPGAAAAEFLLLQPMVPKARPNMSAWIAARMDGSNYGKVEVYAFPKDTSIQGPAQIEGRIDQDPTISSQITPVEPVGVHGGAGQPHRRAGPAVAAVPRADLPPVHQHPVPGVPADRRRVADEGRLGRDAERRTERADGHASTTPPGGSPQPSTSPSPGASAPAASGPPPTAAPGQSPPSGDVKALIAYANAHFEAAQAALRAGNFALYGQEMDLVKAALSQLSVLTGVPSSPPSAAP